MRDRAILATLHYHGIRREELCVLRVKDMQSRQGVVHFRIKGRRDKIRLVPVHPAAQRLIEEYLALAGHGGEEMSMAYRQLVSKGFSANAEDQHPLGPVQRLWNLRPLNVHFAALVLQTSLLQDRILRK